MKKYLIVGLGNIGEKYFNTRHNIGFEILDEFVETKKLMFESQKFGELSIFKFKGRSFYLLKPNTYVNLSGNAIEFWLKKENIPIENLLVIADDLNLSFGSLRLKTRGTNGGHNGLKSIELSIGTTNYNRLRIGISDVYEKGRQVDFVLGKFTKNELNNLKTIKTKVVDLIISFVMNGVSITMNNFNSKF